METRLRTRRRDSQKEVAALQTQIVTRATARKAQEAGFDPSSLTENQTAPTPAAEGPSRRGSSQKAKSSTKRLIDTRSRTPKRPREARRSIRSARKTLDAKPSPNKDSTVEAGPATGKDTVAEPQHLVPQPDSTTAMDRRHKASGDGSGHRESSAEDVRITMAAALSFHVLLCPRVDACMAPWNPDRQKLPQVHPDHFIRITRRNKALTL